MIRWLSAFAFVLAMSGHAHADVRVPDDYEPPPYQPPPEKTRSGCISLSAPAQHDERITLTIAGIVVLAIVMVRDARKRRALSA